MRILLVLGLAIVLATSAAAGKLRKPKRGFQMRAGTLTVQPGQDLEWCEYRRLPNRKAIDVNGFELRMPAGAHHFVIWGYGGGEENDAAFPQGPIESVACTGLGPGDLIPQVLIPIQNPNSSFRFPEGVALRIEPHKQVWLNPHLKNNDAAPIKPDIRFNFLKARKGTVQHYAEGMIVGNQPDIRIPAGGTQTLTAEWTAPVAINLVHLTTHQHRLGTYANIELPTADGSGWEKVVETTDWEHPDSIFLSPSRRLAPGDRMRITCTWHNTDDHEVRFGVETTDEMCFILGFYYRDPGDTTPVTGSGCLPARSGLFCPFAPAVGP